MILGQLATNEVLDPRILGALYDTPREHFLPVALKGAAYVDEEIDVGNGRYLIDALTLARLIGLAEIAPQSRVLVVGCLSGYAAAVMARLAASVIATEADAALLAEAKERLAALGITNVRLQQVRSLAEGYAGSAPYDAIIICGAIGFLPEPLGAQLAQNGKLAAIRNVAARPGLAGGPGKVMVVSRIGNQLQTRDHFDAACAVLPGFAQNSGFVF